MRITTRSESKLLERIDTKVTMNDNDDKRRLKYFLQWRRL